MEGCSGTISTFMVLVAILVLSCTNMKTSSGSAATYNSMTNLDFVRLSCNYTRYPKPCLNSLTSYSGKIKKSYPKLAYTALNVSLTSARAASKFVSQMTKQQYLKPNEKAAIKDCVEIAKDSIDEIRQALKELKSLNATRLNYRLSNIKTWVSASLSDEDTCLTGLDEEYVNQKVKNSIRKCFLNVAQLTSNALVFINGLNYAKLKT